MKKPEEPNFPKRAMERAKKIDGPEAFNFAADHLQRAVGSGNQQTEKFWRKVFGAYAHIIAKRGADDTTWHLMNTAADYEQDGTPGQISRQMTPEEERDIHNMPPIPEPDDPDIPF